MEIGHWFEDDDNVPIIPVEGTPSWRPGGMRMLYVAFDSLLGNKPKRFALGFDEPRLFEAISVFLEATQAYENSDMSPVVWAESTEIENIGGSPVLRIKLLKGATIAVHLPAEALAKLSEQLKK